MKRLPFSNRYVFAKVMQDNPDLCKEVIERVLDIKINHIESIEIESESTSITHRGVRFDVFLKSDEAAFEVEMQTYEQKELPKRMRYYRSQLDRRMLAKGEAFDGLKPVYVVFICLDDPFGYDLPVYTFTSTCKENPAVPFNNGAFDVVLCAHSDLNLTSPAISNLLQFVATDHSSESDYLTVRLAAAVESAYNDEDWVKNMSWLDWDIQDAKAHAAAEGRAEGLAEGLAEGREKGREEGITKGQQEERDRQVVLVNKMQEAGCSPEEILAALTTSDRDALYKKYAIDTRTTK